MNQVGHPGLEFRSLGKVSNLRLSFWYRAEDRV